eukprot:6410896-Prymnesium_polylepis.1
MPKRSPIDSMPLFAPTRIEEGKKRTRVEVLLDTVKLFERDGDLYAALAQQNMARWEAGKPKETFQSLVVMDGDMLENAGVLTKYFGTPFVCLNMANEDYPGGGYTEGCSAQEENMFRRTNAHFTLDSTNLVKQGRKVVYADTMNALVSGKLGVNYISAYEKPLVCIKGKEVFAADDLGYKMLADDEIFFFYELRSAAVDISHRKKKLANIEALMASRIAAQFATLVSRGFRHVVLSAFGCGAFGNDPRMVA